MPKKTTVTKFQLTSLQSEHGSDAEIGKVLKISRQAVHQLRKKYGIESTRSDQELRNNDIMSAYEKGKTGIEIGSKLDISASQVYRIIKGESVKRGIEPQSLDKRRS
jgi:DNA-directed RNA polymerase specialized sigma subunit